MRLSPLPFALIHDLYILAWMYVFLPIFIVFVLEVVVVNNKFISFVRHHNIVEVATLLDGLYCVLLVYIGVAEVYQYDLLGACAQILLAELGAIVKTKMPLWMAHAHIVVAEVVQ